jgi:GrpB-like predicted nucleotidyltransferase (UPF0157 family)
MPTSSPPDPRAALARRSVFTVLRYAGVTAASQGGEHADGDAELRLVARCVSYQQEAAALERALGDGVVAIEHVGSTAVDGLPGRSILDLMVGLVTSEPSADQLDALRRLGYRPPRRRTRRLYVARGTPRAVTVHFAQWGSARWWRLIEFRDTLREDPDARRRYTELKASLSESGPARYAEAKRRFVEAELIRAKRSRKLT